MRENQSEPGAGRGDRAKPDPTIRCRPGIFGMASGGCSGGYAFVFVGAPAGGIAGSRSPKTRQAHGTGADRADGTVTPLPRNSTAARNAKPSVMVVSVGEASLMGFKPKAGKGRIKPRLAA